MAFLILLLILAAYAELAAATLYEVGPGFPKTKLRDVVWDQLLPGDVVNIHATPGGYHETILLSRSGTAAQRIVVRGIPDAQGNLPLLDASNAVIDPNIHLRYNSLKGLGAIIVSTNDQTNYGVSPSYIDIESLEIRNAHSPYSYTDGAVTHNYSSFVAGIYVEHSHHMAIRGCNLHHNGLGVFANSKYGASGTSTEDILVEHNWIHENGAIGSFSVHGIYVESVGAVYQYNIIGPQLAGAGAAGLKDRSSGTVVRYNTFINAGGNYLLMLIDPAYPIQYARPDYLETFVYGNTFYNTPANGGSSILYGGDQPDYSRYRHGTLYFYNNTVVNIGDNLPFRSGSVFELPRKVVTGGAATIEKLNLRNNIFASLPLTPGTTASPLYLLTTDVPGTMDLGTNWVSPGTLLSTSQAVITGAANLIYGDAGGANNPGFLNSHMRDFRLATGARSIDAAGPMAPTVSSNTLGQSFFVTEEILPVAASQPRAVLGAGMDLGAYESDGATVAAAPGELGFAYSTYGQVWYENSGTLAFTVSRLGGSSGAVDISYDTVDAGAVAGLDYVASSGTLHWAAGDATPKTFTVIILPDALVEPQEAFGVVLTNPTNGALQGPGNRIDVFVRDGSGNTGGGGTPAGGYLAFPNPTVTVSEGVGLAAFTVNRSGSSTGSVSVTYTTSNGSASAADYTAATGTLTWAAGDLAPKTFSIPINDDALTEPGETIVATLSSPTGGAGLGNPSTEILTINDNDHTPAPPRELIYAVGATSDALIAFYSDAPQTPLLSLPISGIPASDAVRAIDFDPLTGRLYALTVNVGLPVTSNHLYVIDPLTGVATLVNPISFTPLLIHPSCDIAFNPATGELHVAVGIGQQNLRLNSKTGTVIATDTPFAYAAGDVHSGQTPSIIGADFQSSPNGTIKYFGIDQTQDVMVRIGASPATPAGGILTTLGPLGIDTTGITGLDFSPTSGGAFACMGGSGATTGDFYYLDTVTGSATLVGQIALSEAVRDIAVAPAYLAWKFRNFAANVVNPDIAGDHAMPAGDGVENLIKYALGMDPGTSSTVGLPDVDLASGHLRMGFTRPAGDIRYVVEVSDDLTTWAMGNAYGPGSSPQSPAVTDDVTAPNSPAGWTMVQDRAGTSSANKRFMRLRIELP